MFGHDSYKQFALVRDVKPQRTTLHVFGDVDRASAAEFREAIDEAAADGISLLIDLSKCRYFDSSGLAALVQARKALGTRLTLLVAPRSQILRVMQLVGFDALFNVVTELHTTFLDEFVRDTIEPPAPRAFPAQPISMPGFIPFS